MLSCMETSCFVPVKTICAQSKPSYADQSPKISLETANCKWQLLNIYISSAFFHFNIFQDCSAYLA